MFHLLGSQRLLVGSHIPFRIKTQHDMLDIVGRNELEGRVARCIRNLVKFVIL